MRTRTQRPQIASLSMKKRLPLDCPPPRPRIWLFIAASVASVSAFAPASKAPTSTQLNESLFKKISNMDLWEPVKDSNDYGGRSKKNLKTGTLTEKSYVPFGLTKAQYEKIRSEEASKKDANYQRNVKKAGVFTDYTQFYLKRGTEENGSWMNMPNRGHDMAKTKYDWSGEKNDAPTYTGVDADVGKKKFKFF